MAPGLEVTQPVKGELKYVFSDPNVTLPSSLRVLRGLWWRPPAVASGAQGSGWRVSRPPFLLPRPSQPPPSSLHRKPALRYHFLQRNSPLFRTRKSGCDRDSLASRGYCLAFPSWPRASVPGLCLGSLPRCCPAAQDLGSPRSPRGQESVQSHCGSHRPVSHS